MKYINFKRYKFSTATKYLSTLTYNFLKIFSFLDPRRYNFRKIYKYINIDSFDFRGLIKFFNVKKYDFGHIKRIKLFSSKFFLIHLPASIIFFGFLYIFIPIFYTYEKSDLEKAICKNENVQCIIKGKVNYTFYPTPRIKIKDLVIYDLIPEKNKIISVKEAAIKLSIKNLLAEEKHLYKKVKLKNFEINLSLKNFKRYKKLLTKKINFIPLEFKSGKILIFDKKEFVGTISKVDINLKFADNLMKADLNGKFLEKNINIEFFSDEIDKRISRNFVFKIPDLNFYTKINFFIPEDEKNIIDGKILTKQNKNKITAIFDYADNKLKIKKSNLRNPFMEGKLEGIITFLPYFNFNLDLNLNSINLTKLHNSFLILDEDKQKKLFKINKKINGKINLSSDKIYSSYNLIRSLESRIQFSNGNILIDQLLLNMGKLGAADLVGVINNDKKFVSFTFESNIFVDNQKKFLNKFNIYNKEKIFSNLFIAASLDLENYKAIFYEISNDKKLSNEDVNFIEKEFNYFMFENGYKNLFLFPKFKEFVKSINSEIN